MGTISLLRVTFSIHPTYSLRLTHCTVIGNANPVMKCNGRLNLITYRQSVCRISFEQKEKRKANEWQSSIARTVNGMLYSTLISAVYISRVCGMNNQNKYKDNSPQNLQIAAMNERINNIITMINMMMMIIATMIDSNLSA